MSNIDEQQRQTLGLIFDAINRADDLLPILNEVLAQVVELTGQSAGWILLQDNGKGNTREEFLAAHCHLPPAFDIKFGGHVCFPLRSNDHFYGVLNVLARDGEGIGPDATNTLAAVTAHLSTALDRQQLAGLMEERHNQEQAALLMLTSQLLRTTELDDVLEYLVKEVIGLFQVDACALLLPDERSDYLVFRASAGWRSDPVAQQRRIPGNHQSSAGRVMRDQAPVHSKSATDRGDMPEMTIEWLDEERFEGIVIVPLVVDGQSIGALSITTRTPREFDKNEIHFLQILANQAAIAIKNSRLQKEEIQLKRLEEELSIGRRIQRSLLPVSSPAVAGWQFSDIYRPARHVGGDLYDYFELPHGEKRLGLVIGDVADKGVPAALFMATSRTLIRSVALAGLQAASTLREANRLILQDSPSELFLSAFYGILDSVNGRLNYASAGHNPPLLFRQSTNEIITLNAQGIVLCVLDEISLEERAIDIDRGDILVLYTDGVTETMNARYEEFGLARLKRVVAANSQKSAAEILEAIIEAVDAFLGYGDQSDDLTLVVAKRL
jgi:serine phosphatase RsbU (regulator of sigma subunit)